MNTRKHTGEKPHMCNHCGKAFSRKDELTIHTCTQIGEKPHQCNECDKVFLHTSGLNWHIRTHTGEKTHQCSQCDKAFSWKGQLIIYTTRTHTIEKPL